MSFKAIGIRGQLPAAHPRRARQPRAPAARRGGHLSLIGGQNLCRLSNGSRRLVDEVHVQMPNAGVPVTAGPLNRFHDTYRRIALN